MFHFYQKNLGLLLRFNIFSEIVNATCLIVYKRFSSTNVTSQTVITSRSKVLNGSQIRLLYDSSIDLSFFSHLIDLITSSDNWSLDPNGGI